MGADKNNPTDTVCTLYNDDGPNQIMCRISGILIEDQVIMIFN